MSRPSMCRAGCACIISLDTLRFQKGATWVPYLQQYELAGAFMHCELRQPQHASSADRCRTPTSANPLLHSRRNRRHSYMPSACPSVLW